jgi:hypothetical protein
VTNPTLTGMFFDDVFVSGGEKKKFSLLIPPIWSIDYAIGDLGKI